MFDLSAGIDDNDSLVHDILSKNDNKRTPEITIIECIITNSFLILISPHAKNSVLDMSSINTLDCE